MAAAIDRAVIVTVVSSAGTATPGDGPADSPPAARPGRPNRSSRRSPRRRPSCAITASKPRSISDMATPSR